MVRPWCSSTTVYSLSDDCGTNCAAHKTPPEIGRTCSRNPLGRWLSARGSEEGTELAEEDLLELAVCVCPGHSGHSRCPVSLSLAQRAARAVCMRDTSPPLAAVLVLTETSGLSVCVLDIG